MFINKNLSICDTQPPYEETRELSQEEIALILRGSGYSISYEAIVDISDTDEYIAEQRLKEIDQELKQEDMIFIQKGEIIKEYNGKPYKIKYANDYQALVLPSYTNETEKKDIWDATEFEFIAMNKAELTDLYNALKPDYEFAFQVRKTNRARLLAEKQELLKPKE